ncbi:hypothetical protein FHS14_004644 [Paenibacillus baekrokdamisoli]|uniref:hypothetical protein n=1 Tax=Paenibacillus baekrokdamisoli TaxID=1712516 RepID=UPI000F783D2F|nr:hypothetical protein [Paenibacillus baekrokdamisoli]MBB3071635.1 hypothetical protein [Paenibacillus baekrokdamisoli]
MQAMFRRNKLIEFARYLADQHKNHEQMRLDRPDDQYTLGLTSSSKILYERYFEFFRIEPDEVTPQIGGTNE